MAAPTLEPQLQLFRGVTLLERNDNGAADVEMAAAVSRLGSFPFASATSKDAVLLVTLPSGDCRLVGKHASGSDGHVLVEVRELH